MSKFKPIRDSQLYLLPPSVEDFIPESHLARVVNEAVDTLDVSSIEAKYSEMGQKSYHPRILFKLLFYGYCTGNRSGRKIAAACESDTAYMYLASMYRPDFRTINDFRKDNIGFVKNAFVHVLHLCRQMGMLQVGHLIIDGTKLRANASGNRSRHKADYEKWLEEVEEQISNLMREAEKIEEEENKQYGDNRGDELPEQLRSKQQLKKKIQEALRHIKKDEKANLTDPEAKFIRSKQQIDVNYNCQAGVNEEGVIVCAFTSNEARDSSQLLPAIQQAEENTSVAFPVVLADSSYASYDNYELLEAMNKSALIPDQEKEADIKRHQNNPYHRTHFTYVPEQDYFICPQGKPLPFAYIDNREKYHQIRRVYKGKQCQGCSEKKQCTKSTARQIGIELRDKLRQKIRDKLNSPEGKKLYEKRKRIEAIFGNIKHNMNYKNLYLRSIEKTTAEWQLICLASNLKLIHQRAAA